MENDGLSGKHEIPAIADYPATVSPEVQPRSGPLESVQNSVGIRHPASESDFVTMPRKALATLTIPIFPPNDDTPDPKRIMKLGCDEAQASSIKAAIDTALSSLKHEESAHYRVVENGDGQFVAIDAFPERGKAIKEKLYTEIHDVLPDGRADVIIANLSKDIRVAEFGSEPREISAEATQFGDKEIWGYTVKVGRTGGESKTIGGSAFNDLLAKRYQHILGAAP